MTQEVPKELFQYKNEDYADKIRRLYKWMNGNTASPYKLIIFPTNGCNLNCPYCPNSYARTVGRFKKEKELTKEEWLAVVKQGLKFGIKEWRIFGGGEPLVRKKTTLAIINEVKEYNTEMNCEIITNGSLFTPEEAKNLVIKRLDRILFSIDGPNAKIHDGLRGVNGTFKRVINILKTLSKVKRKLKTDKPIVKVNMVINNKNYLSVLNMVKMMGKVKVDTLAIHPMRSYEEIEKQVQGLTLKPEEEEKFEGSLKEAERVAEKYKLRLNIDMVKETKRKEEKENKVDNLKNDLNQDQYFLSSLCFEPFYSIFIDPEGNTAPCCGPGRGSPDYNIKNFTLEEIWKSKLFISTRNLVLQRKGTESCKNCGLLDMTEELRKDLSILVNYKKNE